METEPPHGTVTREIEEQASKVGKGLFPKEAKDARPARSECYCGSQRLYKNCCLSRKKMWEPEVVRTERRRRALVNLLKRMRYSRG